MLTHQRLLEILQYDSETGVFTCRSSGFRRKAGDIAGRAGKPHLSRGRMIVPYWRISVDGKSYSRSKLVWFYVTGQFPDFEIDHRDTDSFNDRFSNLRRATRALNNANRRVFKNNKAGCKGVHYRSDMGKFRAMISVDGRNRSLGHFDTEQAASKAYEVAAQEAFGEFARSA